MQRQFPSKLQIGISVDTKGLSKKIKGLTRIIKQVTEEACQAAAREIAKQGAKEAFEVIENQTKAEMWPPLRPKYLKRKISEGYDPLMLVRSRFYLEHISWWKNRSTGSGRQAQYKFGVRQAIHPDAHMPLGQLAAIHEYGTRDGRVPARMFWRTLTYNLRRRTGWQRKVFNEQFKRYWRLRSKRK